MKKILGEILNNEETPKEVKSRLLESAKAYLLVKDIGELFGSNVPKASLDIAETLVNRQTNPKNKKNEH